MSAAFIPFSVFVESVAAVDATKNPDMARYLVEHNIGRTLDDDEADELDKTLALSRSAGGYADVRDALFTLTRLLRRLQSRDEKAAS